MEVNKEIVEGVRVSILGGKYRKYKEGVVMQACPKVCWVKVENHSEPVRIHRENLVKKWIGPRSFEPGFEEYMEELNRINKVNK
jgi:hypothetical protein